MSSIAKSPWLAIYLVAGFAVITGLFVLLGFSVGAAILGAAAIVCPALLIWLYLKPGKGNTNGEDTRSRPRAERK
jgi:hypothetical protein